MEINLCQQSILKYLDLVNIFFYINKFDSVLSNVRIIKRTDYKTAGNEAWI